jgi:hypothetical protein
MVYATTYVPCCGRLFGIRNIKGNDNDTFDKVPNESSKSAAAAFPFWVSSYPVNPPLHAGTSVC